MGGEEEADVMFSAKVSLMEVEGYVMRGVERVILGGGQILAWGGGGSVCKLLGARSRGAGEELGTCGEMWCCRWR